MNARFARNCLAVKRFSVSKVANQNIKAITNFSCRYAYMHVKLHLVLSRESLSSRHAEVLIRGKYLQRPNFSLRCL